MPAQRPAPSHVVVIGGGIFGASSAEQLVRRGIRTTWVTDRALASGASGRSLAWLNSAGERSEPYHRIRMEGLGRWREFAHRVPGASAYVRFDGGLTWARPGQSYRKRFQHERSLGYDSAWVMPPEIPGISPAVDPSAVNPEGAIFNASEGWVDLPSVIAVLAREFTVQGGTLNEHAGACEPVVTDGHVSGVRTGAGEIIPADAVVLAAGPQSPGILASLGCSIADQSPTACLIFTDPVESGLTAVLNTPNVGMRPTVDGGLAMDSGWSERSVTVDADGTPHVADEAIARLLEEASAVLAGHPRLTVASIGMGGKPIPGDGDPCYGAIAALPGLFVAFSHSGATQGLVAGEVIAHEVVTGEPQPLAAPFRADRLIQAQGRQ